jgi:hypothetical protein
MHPAGKRTRILSTPYGSEVTSSDWYVYDGWAYAWAVIQHPYGETDLDKLGQGGNTGVGGYIGYIGPFKNSELADAIDIDFDEIPLAKGDDRHKVGGLSAAGAMLRGVLCMCRNCTAEIAWG